MVRGFSLNNFEPMKEMTKPSKSSKLLVNRLVLLLLQTNLNYLCAAEIPKTASYEQCVVNQQLRPDLTATKGDEVHILPGVRPSSTVALPAVDDPAFSDNATIPKRTGT